MISVQMRDKEIRSREIDIELPQTGLHRIQAFFSIQTGIDDKISLRRSDHVGI
jgi:hypothetical protein